MVAPADTSPRPPDPAPVPVPAARVAAPPQPQAAESVLPTPSFPILKSWGSRRVLPCVSVNGKGEIVGGGRRKTAEHDEEKAGRRRLVVEDDGGDDDPRIEEVREKLLLHLREAADRMNLAVPFLPIDGIGRKESVPVPEPAAIPEQSAADASEEPPAPRWNLRARLRAPRSPTGNHHYLSGSLPGTKEKAVRLRSEDHERPKRLKFSLSLTKEEIDEDIYSMTGSRARRRPRRRPRAVQKQLDSLFPGSWLSEITADSYKVPDEK